MMMFDYSDHRIPARWDAKRRHRQSGLLLLATLVVSWAAAGQTLDSLATSFRESPTKAHRTALLQFASAHSGDEQGALARFTLGVSAFEQKDYASAAENLELARAGLPKLKDYTSYYLAAARVAAKDMAGIGRDLAPFDELAAPSPLDGKARLLEAQAFSDAGRVQDAAGVLAAHREALPQPEGDLALGQAYRALGDSANAIKYLQQVYYWYPDTQEAAASSDALAALRQSMGAQYPVAPPKLRLTRIQKWIAAREYGRARAELRGMEDEFTGSERDVARVRAGALEALEGSTWRAAKYLRGLSVSDSEADAERLYYLVYCARKADDESGMMDAVDRLNHHPQSPWRLKALVLAGNRYLLQNRADRYEPLYRAAYESFPGESDAAYCQWKVAWNAYLRRRADAADLLREHLTRFPDSSKASAALYFLGRMAENSHDVSAAAGFYHEILQRFPNFYYALLARDRISKAELEQPAVSGQTAEFLQGLTLPTRKPAESRTATAATERRIARARLLATAGFPDWAEAELRFGARTDAQPFLMAIELARRAGDPHQAIRAVKSISPDYLTLSFENTPQRFWQLLFPMPWKRTLVAQAQTRNLDPFMVAGLIRQESEFNPNAVSPAKAYGLTQVLPSTGRKMARQAGIRRFRTSMLLQPEVNLKLGISYLRGMLTEWNGKWEEALASYNAGKSRVDEWLTWADYREPAEFVETIPFTETREYVQAIMRNADLYRRLYGGKPLSVAMDDDSPAESPAPVVKPARKAAKAKVAPRGRKRSKVRAASRSKTVKSRSANAKPARSRVRSAKAKPTSAKRKVSSARAKTRHSKSKRSSSSTAASASSQ